MKPVLLKRLTQAAGTRRVLKIRREESPDREAGFVLRVTEAFVVVNMITDHMHVDGLAVFPLASITEVREAEPRSSFRHAVDLFHLMPAAPGPLVLDSWAAILKSAAAEWEVVTCHLEKRYPGECYIGLVKGIRGQKLHMQLINPKGELEDRVEVFDLPDLTKVEMGGRYESVIRSLWKQSREG